MTSTLQPLQQNTDESTPHRMPITRAMCSVLVKSELLLGRYELIDGEIISKMGQNRLHAIAVVLITGWLIRLFGELFVQCQLPMDVADEDNVINEPEPDVAVLAEPITAYATRNPGPQDIQLVVEVSDTTLAFDRKKKAALYARAGFVEYWVADVNGRRFFVHRQPGAEGYAEITEVAESEFLSPLARPEASIRVADLLPPVA